MGGQICFSVDREGSVARDRASLHLEAEITQNGVTRCEGVWGTFDAA